MRKIGWLVLATMLILSACGNSGENSKEPNSETPKETQQETESVEVGTNSENQTEKEEVNTETNSETNSELNSNPNTGSTTPPSGNSGSESGKDSDGFVQGHYYFWPTHTLTFYDAPSKESNARHTSAEYTAVVLQAYNPDTKWYRTTMGVPGGASYTVYCYIEHAYTNEEYRAVLNQGVPQEYHSLPCVQKAEEYCSLRNNSNETLAVTSTANLDTGYACAHMNGKHYFTTPEKVDGIHAIKESAERAWDNDKTLAGIYTSDGKIQVYNFGGIMESAGNIYTPEEFNMLYPDTNVYNTVSEYKVSRTTYVIDEIKKYLYG